MTPTAHTRSSIARPAVGVVVLLLVLWLTVPWLMGRRASEAASPRAIAARGNLALDEKNTVELFEHARPSVVYITTRERVRDPWTRNVFSLPRGTGSGFVWNEHGDIVTNYHVVADASEARVRLSDGRDVTGTLVGASPAHDLAVLHITVANSPPPVPVGTSHDLKVGQKVFAIGNPFGLDWTLTSGIVSALDRSLPAEQERNLIEHLVQTDAAINPGNSGGPLLDSAGRLIGVNTAIFSPSGAYAGVGFAVPVDTVQRVVPILIGKGKYVRPSLGIEVDEDLNSLINQRLGTRGVVVLQVTKGSGAEAAGIRGVSIGADGRMVPGDIIAALNGQPTESVARLLAKLDDARVGDKVNVTVVRDGNKTDVSVPLEAGR